MGPSRAFTLQLDRVKMACWRIAQIAAVLGGWSSHEAARCGAEDGSITSETRSDLLHEEAHGGADLLMGDQPPQLNQHMSLP